MSTDARRHRGVINIHEHVAEVHVSAHFRRVRSIMDEKVSLDVEDFSSETALLDSFMTQIQHVDSVFMIGLFVALAAVILSVGKNPPVAAVVVYDRFNGSSCVSMQFSSGMCLAPAKSGMLCFYWDCATLVKRCCSLE